MLPNHTFDPVLYSLEENNFILAHLGQPPVVAQAELPATMPWVGVGKVLESVQELEDMKAHRGQSWIGIDKLKDVITAYLLAHQKWMSDRRRGAPCWPSMYSFDTKGRPHWQGIGSDVGQVRTYFSSDGTRIPFAINLVAEEIPQWVPDWIRLGGSDKPTAAGLVLNKDASRLECFCGHTEKFNPDSRASYRTARARISRHLRKAIDEVERHRETHTHEFGS